MAQEVCCVVQTESEARRNVEEIKVRGAAPDTVSVVTGPAQIEHLAHLEPNYLRSAVRGSVVGLIIGVFLGVATLVTIGLSIPSLFEAVLLLACSAFGGILFGSLIGATGAFARNTYSTGRPF